jgi:hypothetical protein
VLAVEVAACEFKKNNKPKNNIKIKKTAFLLSFTSENKCICYFIITKKDKNLNNFLLKAKIYFINPSIINNDKVV